MFELANTGINIQFNHWYATNYLPKWFLKIFVCHFLITLQNIKVVLYNACFMNHLLKKIPSLNCEFLSQVKFTAEKIGL